MKTIKLSDNQAQPCHLEQGEVVTVMIEDVPYLMRVCDYTIDGCRGCSVREHKVSANGKSKFTCEDINSNLICSRYVFVDVSDILEDL